MYRTVRVLGGEDMYLDMASRRAVHVVAAEDLRDGAARFRTIGLTTIVVIVQVNRHIAIDLREDGRHSGLIARVTGRTYGIEGSATQTAAVGVTLDGAAQKVDSSSVGICRGDGLGGVRVARVGTIVRGHVVGVGIGQCTAAVEVLAHGAAVHVHRNAAFDNTSLAAAEDATPHFAAIDSDHGTAGIGIAQGTVQCFVATGSTEDITVGRAVVQIIADDGIAVDGHRGAAHHGAHGTGAIDIVGHLTTGNEHLGVALHDTGLGIVVLGGVVEVIGVV